MSFPLVAVEVLRLLPIDLKEGKLIEATAGNKKIGLLRRGEEIFAFATLCPHAGAPLCDGRLDARGHIVCPLHGYRFNPANGYNSSGEGYKLTTFKTMVKDGKLFVYL